MAEAGEGNIKVVVRCRPLNSRGTPHAHTTSSDFSSLTRFLPLLRPFREPIMQNSQEVQSRSSGCKATRRSWIRQRLGPPRTPSVPRSGKRWHLVLTRVIGLLGLATSWRTVHSRPCTTTWGRNCWTMGLRDLMRVFWLVSPLPSCQSIAFRGAEARHACLDGQTGECLPCGVEHEVFTHRLR